jgi:putative flippase GtrA
MPAKQFLNFILCGGVAAGLNWSSRFLFAQFVAFEVAVILAFFVGLLSGFLLMRFFVFRQVRKSIVRQAGMYITVNFFALLQTLLVSLIFARWVLPGLGIKDNAEALGHFFGILVPVITSYFGHKRLTFR